MSQYRKVRYQKIQLTIAAANAEVSTNQITVDQNYGKVTGIQATCTDATAFNKAYFRKFEIGKLDIYPDGYEAKMIAAGNDCPVNDRFDKDIDEPGNGATIDITYKDAGSATAYPYNLNIYLKLINPAK